MEGTAAYHYLTSAANWVIMDPLGRCNLIELQSPLQQNKSWYRLATRPSANTRRAGHAQLSRYSAIYISTPIHTTVLLVKRFSTQMTILKPQFHFSSYTCTSGTYWMSKTSDATDVDRSLASSSIACSRPMVLSLNLSNVVSRVVVIVSCVRKET